MQIPSITDLLFNGPGILVIKLPLLVLMGVYLLFLLIVISRIKAFGRTVIITSFNGSKSLRIFAYVQFFLMLSLFVITIVIV